MAGEEALSYKQRKEAFASGVGGTSPLEVAAVVLVVPLALRAAELARAAAPPSARRSAVVRGATDAVLVLAPALLALTRPQYLAQLLLLLAALVTVLRLAQRPGAARAAGPARDEWALLGRPAVSVFRFTLLLLTCAMILAIDFPVTPRRFAKAETFGTGLMDIGTGGFVVSNSIVVGCAAGGEARAAGWRAALGRALPLVALGLTRLVMVRSAAYQEPVMEYGVHWNFFFTLAAVAVGVQALASAAPGALRSPARWALVTGVAHQLALDRGGLQRWVLEAPREGLLAANKEGVASAPGYVALYLAGVALGALHRRVASLRAHAVVLAALGGAAALAAAATGVSRRFCNAGYCLWVLASCQQILLAARALAALGPGPASASPSIVLEAFERNQLGVFLLANLLTGLCNVSIDTMAVGDGAATAILGGYLATLALVAALVPRLRPWSAAAPAESGK